jgi:hypothetical protein
MFEQVARGKAVQNYKGQENPGLVPAQDGSNPATYCPVRGDLFHISLLSVAQTIFLTID